ncbi:MAG: hypothetical protein A2X49_02015 [Lentisphaerae bacterium GWF2_52_8]|nr:MAG: hypothetical protein A2X49_02015 [Lentisphaerae bacterium GWF2_52_8]
MTPLIEFLGWDRPVAALVAERLLFEACNETGGLPPVLQSQMIVVPTRQSGRRLRECLAAASPGGVLSPRVVTPEFFFQPPENLQHLMPDSVAQLILADLLGRLPPGRFPHVFPHEIPRDDWAWLLSTSSQLLLLRRHLSEGGLTLADSAARLAASPEPERWEELAEIEELYLAELKKEGRLDLVQLQVSNARHPELPKGLKRIIIAGVPAPIPLALLALGRLAENIRVEVWVHAPGELRELFDEWGRPLPEKWQKQELALPDRRIHLLLKPEQEAEKVLSVLPSGLSPKNAPGLLALGLLDPEIAPHLSVALERRGIEVFNPAETPLLRHPLALLASDLLTLAAEGRFSDFSRLLRNPAMMDYLKLADASPLLENLDKLQNTHIPSSFAELSKRAKAALLSEKKISAPNAERPSFCRADLILNACQRIEELVSLLRGADWMQQLPIVLGRIYEGSSLNLHRSEDKIFSNLAERISGLLKELGDPGLRRWIENDGKGKASRSLFLQLLSSLRLSPEPEGLAVSFDGWLELHWNDAPHLVLAGFNENFVPASVTRHALLPDGARKLLGLPDCETRFARDLYLFCALIESRRNGGSVDVLLGKSSSDGDALKPSRLLFHCPASVLPARAQRLFDRAGDYGTKRVESSWKLVPRKREPLKRISITAFRDYLSCPFRFYLSRVLGMEELSDRKLELDGGDFGSAIHNYFQVFAQNHKMQDSVNPDEIAEFLSAEAESWFADRFGKNMTAALLIQRDIMLQRLRHAALVQAREREKGWRIIPEFVEVKLEKEIIPGLFVSGKIDRVEQNLHSGEYRVLDFKSSDKGKSPYETHFSSPRGETLDYARCELTRNGKTMNRAWADLQLPLYVWLLRDKLGLDAQISCVYFNLPKAVSSTGILAFHELDKAILDSALNCAQGIASDILACKFWPPKENLPFDSFERLCPPGEWHDRFTNIFTDSGN